MLEQSLGDLGVPLRNLSGNSSQRVEGKPGLLQGSAWGAIGAPADSICSTVQQAPRYTLCPASYHAPIYIKCHITPTSILYCTPYYTEPQIILCPT